ncbi:Hypothetical_protein [Hexamita inflata]|uniref:Hypothetical_protein n=1 Tax=Hexamita inflata TaxID=28002 RepID=A0AA86QMK3_9EUKA|nr:Hypothetical protein HINF_LOCUS50061 [Hexamita inflata]
MNSSNYNQTHQDLLLQRQLMKQIDYNKLKSSSIQFGTNNNTFNQSFNSLNKRNHIQRIKISKSLGQLWSNQVRNKNLQNDELANYQKDNHREIDIDLVQRLRCAERRDSDTQIFDLVEKIFHQL